MLFRGTKCCMLVLLSLAACRVADLPLAPTLAVPGGARRYVNIAPSNGVGVNVNHLNGEASARLVPYLSRLHVTVVRFDMLGSDAVQSPGQFTDAGYSETVARIKSEGAVPLAVLTWIPTWACANPNDCNIHKVPSDAAWASIIQTMVSNAVGMGVEYFEVGNEPGIGYVNHLDWSPADYDRLARIAIRIIHDYGKMAMGPAGGSDETLQWYQNRITANVTSNSYDSFDIISVHGYGWGDDIANKVQAVQSMVPGRPVWLTEAAGGGDPEVSSSVAQARILARLMARQTWAQTLWFHLYNTGEPAMPSEMLQFDPSDPTRVVGTEVYRVASRQAGVNAFWSQNTHLFTWDSVEYRGSDRSLETAHKFYLLQANLGGLSPVVRCVFHGARKVRQLSLYGCPSGFIQENLGPAYLSQSQPADDWQPLYTLIGADNSGYYTADAAERATALANGWSDGGVLGYVPITPDLPGPVVSATGRVAVHAAWSQATHVFYKGSYTGSVPAGFLPTGETHFVVSTQQGPSMVPLIQCALAGGRYRVVLAGSCPSGSLYSILGYALPPNNSTVGADHVLTEYQGASGAYFVTADPYEKATMASGGWTRLGDIARVWF
jgi:hypothetical protein